MGLIGKVNCFGRIERFMMKVKDAWSLLACSLIDIVKYYKLPKFKNESDKCTVIVESRALPHLEFVLRKHYYHLDDSWSALFVCTKDNEMFVRDLIEKLDCNVQVLVWSQDIKTQGDYNSLLLNIKFWENIKAKKVLFFQEDGFLLKDGIEQFMQYDYVGAPWPYFWMQSNSGIGNGGFSLRNVSLIKTILKLFSVKEETEVFSKGTQKKEGSIIDGILAEDVYFSRCLEKISEINLPTRDVALNFSCETSCYSGSIGFHALWNGDLDWQKVIINSVKLFSNFHIMAKTPSQFVEAVTKVTSNTGSLVTYSHICQNEKPMSPWVGFVHDYNGLTYRELNSCCKGILTFSEHSKKRINEIASEIPVLSIPFPLNKPTWNIFCWDTFLSTPDKELFEIKNTVITVDKQLYEIENTSNFINTENKIVFLKLSDTCSYDINLLECILTNTPVIVNRCAMTEEYLGKEYPLFFNSTSEVKNLFSLEKLKSAYDYLCANNKAKDKSRSDYFLTSLVNSDFWKNLQNLNNNNSSSLKKNKRAKKTAIVFNAYMSTFGGGERSSLAYALALKNLGFDTKMVVPSPISSASISKVFGSDLSTIPIEFYPLKDYNQLAKLNPDIFVNHTFGSFIKNQGKFGIYTVMFPFPMGFVENTMLNTYNLFLNISGFTKKYTDYLWKIEDAKSFVLHPPIQDSYVRLAKGFLKNKIKKQKSFITVGRFFPDNHCKNQHIMIEEFINARNLSKEMYNWDFHIVGNVNDEPYYLKCVELAKNQPRIFFHKNVSNTELSEMLKKSCFYVHASGLNNKGPQECEHFGLSILEAMAHGCIPIVYNDGGIFDILNVSKGMGFSYSSSVELRDSMISAVNVLWENKTRLSSGQELCLSSVDLVSQESFTKELNSLLLYLL